VIEQFQNRYRCHAVGVRVQVLAIGSRVVVQSSHGEWITSRRSGYPVGQFGE
jgi:hypothetical protein